MSSKRCTRVASVLPFLPQSVNRRRSSYTLLVRNELFVREAIDEADARLFQSTRRKLRADAKYFLLLNFMQMVLAPVRLRGSDVAAALASSLVADVSLVVNEAARQQQSRERDLGLSGLAPEQSDLSGHVVLEAVANNWKDLKLSSFRIWGAD